MSKDVIVERVGFALSVPGAEGDPVLQSFILKELSRFESVSASYVDGQLVVSVSVGAKLSERGVGDTVSRIYSKVLKLVDRAVQKYKKYLEIKDLLDTPAFRVRDVLEGIPALEG